MKKKDEEDMDQLHFMGMCRRARREDQEKAEEAEEAGRQMKRTMVGGGHPAVRGGTEIAAGVDGGVASLLALPDGRDRLTLNFP